MDSALKAELETSAPTIVHLVKIELPTGDLRMIDGAGVIEFDSEIYTGHHDDYGSLANIGDVTDGVDGDAPTLDLAFMPWTNTGAAELAQALAQTSPVYLWEGCVDRATGLLIGEPDLKFAGEVDQPTWTTGANRTVMVSCYSIFDRFFDQEEGVGLNNAHHQSVYAGEEGLAFVTNVQARLPWGSDAPRPNAVKDVDGSAMRSVLRNNSGF